MGSIVGFPIILIRDKDLTSIGSSSFCKSRINTSPLPNQLLNWSHTVAVANRQPAKADPVEHFLSNTFPFFLRFFKKKKSLHFSLSISLSLSLSLSLLYLLL